MKRLHFAKIRLILLIVFAVTAALTQMMIAAIGTQPIADAGLPRYAATEPVVLDGTGSYDPDESGLLSYTWQQVSGPSVTITDANTATPTISDFIQTEEIQECQFELVVSDGELTSLPDTVKVIIVPDFDDSTLQLENPPFDPNKPTIVYFSGGDCTVGFSNEQEWGTGVPEWYEKANVISFPLGYEPDPVPQETWRTYYHLGDMVIVYLSEVAPDYNRLIQSIGWSTGGQPAMDVGIHLNRVYKDARYAVNHVTHLEAPCLFLNYSWDVHFQANDLFLTSSVDGEQCWLDHYYGTESSKPVYQNYLPYRTGDFLLAYLGVTHSQVRDWYRNSLTGSDMNKFNSGVVAGAYWSVVGPGKNLQLAQSDAYYFNWDGDINSGNMSFYDEPNFPGRLPEPVTLVGPIDVGDPNGGVLTCQESENAVGYQLLFGSDSHRVMDYIVISDTPAPPEDVTTILPFNQTWWTVKARDEYGSTIYADPKMISAFNLTFPITNLGLGQKYGYIQDAINQATMGDEIVLNEGTYYENIDFKGKSLTLRSIDTNDPNIVANTVINGSNRGSTIQLSDSQPASSLLAGLTITGGTVGISCGGSAPTIQNCTVGQDGSIAIEYWDFSEPTIIDCNILGQINELIDQQLIACWPLDETEGTTTRERVAEKFDLIFGDPIWHPDGGMVNGAIELDGISDCVMTTFDLDPASGPFSVLAWIKGGLPGQVILSQTYKKNWLSANPLDGTLMTELKGEQDSSALQSETVITDGDWHLVGFVWDGINRILYVDDDAVAQDTQANLSSSEGGLLIGTGNNMGTGTFWMGLIDDVRIYDRAITP